MFNVIFLSKMKYHYKNAIPVLKEYLSYLDSNVKRPIRDYNDCQEALKQCYSALANSYSKSSSLISSSALTPSSSMSLKKEKDGSNNSAAWKIVFWNKNFAYSAAANVDIL
jgi:hypothetical protein